MSISLLAYSSHTPRAPLSQAKWFIMLFCKIIFPPLKRILPQSLHIFSSLHLGERHFLGFGTCGIPGFLLPAVIASPSSTRMREKRNLNVHD